MKAETDILLEELEKKYRAYNKAYWNLFRAYESRSFHGSGKEIAQKALLWRKALEVHDKCLFLSKQVLDACGGKLFS